MNSLRNVKERSAASEKLIRKQVMIMNILLSFFLTLLLVFCLPAGYLLICSGIVLIFLCEDRKKSGKPVIKTLKFFSIANIPAGVLLIITAWISLNPKINI